MFRVWVKGWEIHYAYGNPLTEDQGCVCVCFLALPTYWVPGLCTTCVNNCSHEGKGSASSAKGFGEVWNITSPALLSPCPPPVLPSRRRHYRCRRKHGGSLFRIKAYPAPRETLLYCHHPCVVLYQPPSIQPRFIDEFSAKLWPYFNCCRQVLSGVNAGKLNASGRKKTNFLFWMVLQGTAEKVTNGLLKKGIDEAFFPKIMSF